MKTIYQENVNDICFRAADTVQIELEKFGIVLEDGRYDLIYEALHPVVTTLSGCPPYRNEH